MSKILSQQSKHQKNKLNVLIHDDSCEFSNENQSIYDFVTFMKKIKVEPKMVILYPYTGRPFHILKWCKKNNIEVAILEKQGNYHNYKVDIVMFYSDYADNDNNLKNKIKEKENEFGSDIGIGIYRKKL